MVDKIGDRDKAQTVPEATKKAVVVDGIEVAKKDRKQGWHVHKSMAKAASIEAEEVTMENTDYGEEGQAAGRQKLDETKAANLKGHT